MQKFHMERPGRTRSRSWGPGTSKNVSQEGETTMKAVKYILALVLVLTLTVPAMAGNGPGGPGGGGGETEIPDTGELYGDLYVILRDEDGLPIWDITYLNGVA